MDTQTITRAILSLIYITLVLLTAMIPVLLSSNKQFQLVQIGKNISLLFSTLYDIQNNKYYGFDMLKIRLSLCLNILVSTLMIYNENIGILKTANLFLYLKYFIFNDVYFFSKLVDYFPNIDFRFSDSVNKKVNFEEFVKHARGEDNSDLIIPLIKSALTKSGLVFEEYNVVIAIIIKVISNTNFYTETVNKDFFSYKNCDYYIDNTFALFETFKDGYIIQNVDSLFAKDFDNVKFKAKCKYNNVENGVKLTLIEYHDKFNNKIYNKKSNNWSYIISVWRKHIHSLKYSGLHTITHGLNSIIFNEALTNLGKNDEIFKFIQMFAYSDEGFLTRAGTFFLDLPSWIPFFSVPNHFDKTNYFGNYEIEDILKSKSYKRILFPENNTLPNDYNTMNIYKKYEDAIYKLVDKYVSNVNLKNKKYSKFEKSIQKYLNEPTLDINDILSIVLKNVIIHHSIHSSFTPNFIRNFHSINNIDYLVQKFINKDNQKCFQKFSEDLKVIEKYCEDNNNILLCPSLVNPYISY